MKFNINKVIFDPNKLIIHQKYYVGKTLTELKYNIENNLKSLHFSNISPDGMGCDGLGSLWNFWYPVEEPKKKWVPYVNADLRWTGKTVVSKKYPNNSMIITDIESTEKLCISFAYRTGISLATLFNEFTWLDGSPCGMEVEK